MQKYFFDSPQGLSSHLVLLPFSTKQSSSLSPSGCPSRQLFQVLSVPSDQRYIPWTLLSVAPTQWSPSLQKHHYSSITMGILVFQLIRNSIVHSTAKNKDTRKRRTIRVTLHDNLERTGNLTVVQYILGEEQRAHQNVLYWSLDPFTNDQSRSNLFHVMTSSYDGDVILRH